jgi:hypothetical protein
MSEDTERTLDAELGAFALELQGMAAAQKGGRAGANGAAPGGGVEQAPIEDVVAALAVIPNGDGWDDGCGWDDWNTIGMAAWHATGGSVDGYEAWSAWSGRCADKHDELACQERWTHWGRSPPARVGIGKLAILAKRATGGTWRQPSAAPEKEFDRDEEAMEDGGGGVPRARRAGGAGRSGDSLGADVGEELSEFMQLARRVVYVLDVHRFYDEVTYLLLDEARLCAVASELGVEGFAVKGKNGIVAQLMGHPGGILRRAHSVTVRPGQGLLVQEAEGLCVNLWRPTELVPSGGDASRWVDHMARLIPDDADRERTIDRFAYALQNPGVKLNSALVLLGGQGTGKDSALAPFWAAVGEHNHAVVPGMQIGGDFNEYMQKPWLLVTEMPSFRKRSSYEEIKALLTTPPDRIRINLKGVSAFSVPNIVNLIVTTNHADAIALAEDDRRFDVVDTVLAGDAAYFKAYYAWLDAGGKAAVMGWLLAREVTAFNPKQAPPVSAAKVAMTREAEAPAMGWARSLWGPDGPMSGRVLVTLDELVELARRGVWGASGFGPGHRLLEQLKRALAADGWRTTKVQVSEGDSRPRVWAREAVELYAQMEPKLLRTKLEEDRKRSAGSEF